MSDPNQPAAPGSWPPPGGQGGEQPGWGQQQPQGWGQQPPAPGYYPGQQGYGPPPAYGQPFGYQRPQPPGTYFDQEGGLYLPNGTTLSSTGRRIGAWFLGGLLFVVTLGIGYFIWSLIIWGRGQTPKYQVLKMRCIKRDTAQVAGWGTMCLRQAVGCYIIYGFLPIISHIVALVLLVTRGDRQIIADLLSTTVVVDDPDKVLAADRPPA